MSTVIFEHQVKVFEAFKKHMTDNKIRIPVRHKKRRELFVDWYLMVFDSDPEEFIYDLSNFFLFLSKKTTEHIIFNHESRSRKGKQPE